MIHSVYYTVQTFSVRPYGFLDNYKIRILSVNQSFACLLVHTAHFKLFLMTSKVFTHKMKVYM